VLWYNGVPANKTPPKDYNKWRDLVAAIIGHCQERYGAEKVRDNWYFEVWNEPDLDWFFTGTQADYFKMYDYAAEGLKSVDPECRIGGPTTSGQHLDWIEAFLEHVTSGTNYATGETGTKADFISYHRYVDDDPSNQISNPSLIVSFHNEIVDKAGEYGYKGAYVCTDWAPTWQVMPEHSDIESPATFVAKTIHMLNENGSYPIPTMYGWWVLSDVYEELKKASGTAFDGSYGLLLRGEAGIEDSYDVPKPVFNVYKLLHKLGDMKLACSGGNMSNGVNAIATITDDAKSIQVLVYNHINGGTADPSGSDAVSLTIQNIPHTPAEFKVEHFVVDIEHSNSYRVWRDNGSPSSPSASLWTSMKEAAQLAYLKPPSTVNLSDGTYATDFDLHTYGTSLIVLTNLSTPIVYPGAALSNSLDVQPSFRVSGRTLVIEVPYGGSYTARLVGADGRILAALSGGRPGKHEVALDRVANKLCILRVQSHDRSFAKPVVVVP
jgi:xylan 1,4-beta-xylosidase